MISLNLKLNLTFAGFSGCLHCAGTNQANAKFVDFIYNQLHNLRSGLKARLMLCNELQVQTYMRSYCNWHADQEICQTNINSSPNCLHALVKLLKLMIKQTFKHGQKFHGVKCLYSILTRPVLYTALNFFVNLSCD